MRKWAMATFLTFHPLGYTLVWWMGARARYPAWRDIASVSIVKLIVSNKVDLNGFVPRWGRDTLNSSEHKQSCYVLTQVGCVGSLQRSWAPTVATVYTLKCVQAQNDITRRKVTSWEEGEGEVTVTLTLEGTAASKAVTVLLMWNLWLCCTKICPIPHGQCAILLGEETGQLLMSRFPIRAVKDTVWSWKTALVDKDPWKPSRCPLIQALNTVLQADVLCCTPLCHSLPL